MRYHDEWLQDCTDSGFQAAFRAYFDELGVRVTDWAGLFAEMGAGPNEALIRRDEDGRAVAFLLGEVTEASAWKGFFTAKMGFVQEFWVSPADRGRGHGAALLAKAEERFREAGCVCAILTTDTAEAFYRRQGYAPQKGVHARNQDAVFVKMLA